MLDKQGPAILEGDVYDLTASASKELAAAGTSLSPLELKLLVLIDGKSTIGETAVRARALGIDSESVLETMRKLAEAGLIELAGARGGALDFVDFFEIKGPVTPSKATLAEAKKAAAATTLLLQQGYFVRIVRRASSMRVAETATATVLVVEDEPVLASLLKHVLQADGFNVRNATNREEIVEQLRCQPIPDLVLLDVVLPDVDGFLVLNKIRQHPALKSVAVVMLTSKATRGAVLGGLAGGADGYITKPFEIPVLLKAVHAVLGLPENGLIDETGEDPWPA